MSTEQDDLGTAAKKKEAIKHRILKRTGGRIEALEVALIDDGVIIRGVVACYYVKQLVLQAAFETIGSESANRIELDVQVACAPRNPAQTQCEPPRRPSIASEA